MMRAKEAGLLRGLKVGVAEQADAITHLFFVDDMLVFSELDVNVLLNLICISLCFQAISGFKIYLAKSELVRLGGGANMERLAKVLGYKVEKLRINYLGMPLGAKYKDMKI